jgi:ABC-type glutathione transport system ATPase component
VLRPELLILDEPLAGLDASVKAQVLNLLLDLRHNLGMSYLLISHDMESTHYAADRIAVMAGGTLVKTI